MINSKNSNLVSIIIPAYNCEKNILACIESITNQNYVNIEIIVVNDGSSDNTENIVRKAAKSDSRIRLINQTNKGVSAARNCGIHKSKGTYITFVDSDDRLMENALSCMINLYTENPNASLVQGVQNYADSKSITEADKLQLTEVRLPASQLKTVALNRFSYTDNKWGISALMIQSVHGCYGKLYKRDIVAQNQLTFNEELGLGEDLLFYLDYLEYSEVVVITDKPVYFINENISSSTRGLNGNMPRYASLMIYQLAEKRKDGDYDEADICEAIINHIGVAMQSYYTHPEHNKNMLKRCTEFRDFIKQQKLEEVLRHSADVILSKNTSSKKDMLLLKLLSAGRFRTYCFVKCVNRQVRG
ncbi:MAG: glycosyltransferase [Lachnospiraceae bacterium]|nr:glycosyltransferase [Lachnospiraceae bacterium]